MKGLKGALNEIKKMHRTGLDWRDSFVEQRSIVFIVVFLSALHAHNIMSICHIVVYMPSFYAFLHCYLLGCWGAIIYSSSYKRLVRLFISKPIYCTNLEPKNRFYLVKVAV